MVMANDESTNTERVVPTLALPAAAADAMQVAGRLQRIEGWADRMAVRGAPQRPLAFSRALSNRFDIRFAPGSRALNFARRLLPDPIDVQGVELTVSPYAPPMRQLSSVRQGVPMWSASDANRNSASPQFAPAARSRPSAPPVPPVPKPSQDRSAASRSEIPADLSAILNAHRALGHIE